MSHVLAHYLILSKLLFVKNEWTQQRWHSLAVSVSEADKIFMRLILHVSEQMSVS